MKSGRWIKPATRVSAPTSLMCVVVRGIPVATGRGGGSVLSAWGGAAWSAARWRRGRWGGRVAGWADEQGELQDAIQAFALPARSVWIVSPVASWAATLAGLWERWDAASAVWAMAGPHLGGPGVDQPAARTPNVSGVPTPLNGGAGDVGGDPLGGDEGVLPRPGQPVIRTLVTNGNPDILDWIHDGLHFRWVSGCQYLPCREEVLAQSLGIPAPGDDPTARADLWLRAMTRLCDWWRGIRGGPWRTTVSGLAESYVRMRIAPRTILRHGHEQVGELEEQALFGGRASTWCYLSIGDTSSPAADGSAGPPRSPHGWTPGRLEHWDIKAMYPTLLSSRDFPTRPVVHEVSPPLRWLADHAGRFGVVARVRLAPGRAEWPIREGERVSYPVGDVVTTLAGPELLTAMQEGIILEVHRAAAYQMGRPFEHAAGELIRLREHPAIIGDRAYEMLAKLLGNSYSGKLAQRRSLWQPRPDVRPQVSWGEWSELDGGTGERRRYRTAAGLVWEKVPAPNKGRPLAGVYAWLTSYGRVAMRSIREGVMDGRVVSQDTDGVWVINPSPDDFGRAVEAARSHGLLLRRTAQADGGRWLGPRHYWTSKGWVLAGLHRPRPAEAPLSWTDSYTVIPDHGADDGQPTGAWEHTRAVNLRTIPADGSVGPDGWVTPRVVSRWVPPQRGTDPVPL